MGILGIDCFRLDSIHGIRCSGRSNAWSAFKNEVYARSLGYVCGSAAASLTWAYTAEGIITVMHKYKLEAAIPIAIIAFIGMAFLHMRSTKIRRQAELFEALLDSFHADIRDKYGSE